MTSNRATLTQPPRAAQPFNRRLLAQGRSAPPSAPMRSEHSRHFLSQDLIGAAFAFERPLGLPLFQLLPLLVLQLMLVTGLCLAAASFGALVRDLTGFTDVRPIEDLFDYLGESIERGDPVWISTRPGSRSRAATTARSRRIASARRTSSTVAPAARTPCAPTSRSTSAPR